MASDWKGPGVESLDPESRALIELSVIRGVPDEELAGMLGIGVERLQARRDDVMGRMGAHSEKDRRALAEALRSGDEEEASPPRRRGLALAGGAAIAVVVALVLALGGDDSSDPKPPAGPSAPGGPRDGRLETLGGVEGGGTARITGRGERRALRMTVQGLPRTSRGGYVIWLYNSLSDARPLSGSRRRTFSLREPLPAGYDRYRFIDVSREPADGNRNHSGQSVLRVPLDRVPGA